jgi:hypothetical protein
MCAGAGSAPSHERLDQHPEKSRAWGASIGYVYRAKFKANRFVLRVGTVFKCRRLATKKYD